jgi:hypothetical protein
MRLLVIQGPDKGICYSMLGDLVFVGREGCQINLNDSNISKKHAEIGWKGSGYFIKDLGSSNGVVHNGQRVSTAELKPGDILMLGVSVIEVYPPGQARRNDRPLLPGNAKRAPLALAPPPGGEGGNPKLSPEELKKKRETDKKRLIVYVGLFFLAFTLYFSEGDHVTIKENAKLDPGEVEVKGKPRKKHSRKAIQEALADYVPNYAVDTQQRRDAEIFFRNGVRELQNKNFRRSFTAFETALTVDPTHELAKIYLKSAKKQMLEELTVTMRAAIRAQKSLRYREARMHYDNVIRYLEGETDNNDFMDPESNKKIKKMYEKAQKEIKELDKEENRLE